MCDNLREKKKYALMGPRLDFASSFSSNKKEEKGRKDTNKGCYKRRKGIGMDENIFCILYADSTFFVFPTKKGEKGRKGQKRKRRVEKG